MGLESPLLKDRNKYLCLRKPTKFPDRHFSAIHIMLYTKNNTNIKKKLCHEISVEKQPEGCVAEFLILLVFERKSI